MEHHVNLVHNIPFFSVFFAMFCGIITPLLKSGRAARHLHGFIVGLVGILSVVLLANVVKNQEAYTFMMGHFPHPGARIAHRASGGVAGGYGQCGYVFNHHGRQQADF